MAEQLRLMAVHAHPDDESSKGAATMAQVRRRGRRRAGRRPAPAASAAASSTRSWTAPEIVGQHRRDPPGRDGRGPRDPRRPSRRGSASSTPGCPRATRCRRCPRAASAWSTSTWRPAPLVKLIREFRPHVITTYDENGGYPHPDHIMCHKISRGGVRGGRRPRAATPRLGEPWQPLKLYYNRASTKARTLALHEAMLAAGLESPYGEWLKRWDERAGQGRRGSPPGCRARDYFQVRDEALRAHATQIDPDGFWFQVPLEIQQKVWPTEDFELARSLVDSPLPEDDLFAGIRDAMPGDRRRLPDTTAHRRTPC